MITLMHGDILEGVTEEHGCMEVDSFVNPVNCVGIMGKGLAAQVLRAFPAASDSYIRACRQGKVQLGKIYAVHRAAEWNPHVIFHFPTKVHWRDDSTLMGIAAGLASLVTEVHVHNVRSIAIPALGCGNGHLAWKDVRPMIEAAFQPVPRVEVRLYVPEEAHG